MRAQLVEVICDTSFLIHMATRQVRNIDRIGEEIGQLTFAVPQVVLDELGRLSGSRSKRSDALQAAKFAGSLKTLNISGRSADDALAEYATGRRIMVATMDKNLKRRLRALGCSIVSFSNDNIVLEPNG